MGKSRLVQLMKERLAAEPHFSVECRCLPHYQNTALYPVTDYLERLMRFSREDTSEEKLSKLEATVGQYFPRLTDVTPLLAALLSVPLDCRYPPLDLSPQRLRQDTLEVLVGMLLEVSEEQPTVFIMEDLRWADPSTLELLDLIVDQGPTNRIATVLTFRPEFVSPWSGRAHLTQITVNRLTRGQVTAIVEELAGGKSLPAEVLEQVVSKTDGVPLFGRS